MGTGVVAPVVGMQVPFAADVESVPLVVGDILGGLRLEVAAEALSISDGEYTAHQRSAVATALPVGVSRQHVEIPVVLGGCVLVGDLFVGDVARQSPFGFVRGRPIVHVGFGPPRWGPSREGSAAGSGPHAVESQSASQYPGEHVAAVGLVVVILGEEPTHHGIRGERPPSSDRQLTEVVDRRSCRTTHIATLGQPRPQPAHPCGSVYGYIRVVIPGHTSNTFSGLTGFDVRTVGRICDPSCSDS